MEDMMLAMEPQELECLQIYQNISIEGPYCEAAWDSFLCWPPAAPGEILFRPCPLLDAIGTIVGESSHPDMFAVRRCDETGMWLGNFTNFTRCVSDMEELYPNSWTPIAIALIVIIGSSLSIISLVISLFIFFYFKSLKCSRLKVHCNLSIALLLHLLLLIVSSSPILTNVSYKHTEWVCKGILTLQMYSALASINWMFVEGLLLHSRVTVHIFKKDAPFKLYYCIGWGLPAVCIGLWCTVMSYYHDTHCWSGYGGQQYIWLITGPMLAALLVNTVFLVDIIRILVTKRLVKQTAETAQVRKAVKATALLFPLLGMPHLLFCINPRDNGTLEEVYMMVNAFVKSSQGLFVSILYCFMNADVQMALRKAYMRTLSRRNPDLSSRCRRGLSQTSGSYMMSSQSENISTLVDTGCNKKRSLGTKTVLRMQESPNVSKKFISQV